MCMKQPVNTKPLPRKKYDLTFKQEAVSLWKTSGKPAHIVAQELGIRPGRLYSWSQTFAPPPPGGEEGGGAKPRLSDLLQENETLRRELEHVRQQRDILKKTLGILSEPPKHVTNGSPR
jgi:transposase